MKIKNEQKFWSLVLFISLAVAILYILGGIFNVVLGISVFEDDFNAYNIGTLYYQGAWTLQTENGALVVDDPTAEGIRAVKSSETTGVANSTGRIGDPVGVGTLYFYAYLHNAETGYVEGHFLISDDYPQGDSYLAIQFEKYSETETTINIYDGCNMWEDYAIVDDEEWIAFGIDWNTTTHQSRFLVNETWSDWYDCYKLVDDFDRVLINGESNNGSNWWLDYIDEEGELPMVERVWGIDPASETEITSEEATFEFGWDDLNNWDTLLVVFQNRPTGIFSQAKLYDIETIGISGTKELTFADFNFDRNGKYYFYSVASKLEVEVIEGMFLTGGYSYEWTDDLVNPEHWFTINIDGLSPIFEMSDFETWYSEVSKFATSTAMFVSIAGFFDPVFSYIGEFGNRIKDYFNLNEAYEQGYQIGKTIPYFTFFVAQVSLFLGGFPILKWVFVVILLLIGIFIFRLVLKFIPGLG